MAGQVFGRRTGYPFAINVGRRPTGCKSFSPHVIAQARGRNEMLGGENRMRLPFEDLPSDGLLLQRASRLLVIEELEQSPIAVVTNWPRTIRTRIEVEA
jgi:hypothetical protein